MSKVQRKQAERGSRRMATDAMRQALHDRRYWVGLGLVYVPGGEELHYEIDPDIGVIVYVQLMPDEEPLQCRLGGLGEGVANGVWRIPPVGSEVAVCCPAGEIHNDPMIVGVLSSGGTPSELDADTLVVRAPKVTIIATGGAVEVGQKGLGPTDGVVHGAGIDPFSGESYTNLNNTSSTLKAKK